MGLMLTARTIISVLLIFSGAEVQTVSLLQQEAQTQQQQQQPGNCPELRRRQVSRQ